MGKSEGIGPHQETFNLGEGLSPTHTVLKGASVQVETGRGWAWSVVTTDVFNAYLIDTEEIPKSERSRHRGLRCFESFDPFEVHLSNAGRPWGCSAGSRFWGFLHPQDHTVHKIRRTK